MLKYSNERQTEKKRTRKAYGAIAMKCLIIEAQLDVLNCLLTQILFIIKTIFEIPYYDLGGNKMHQSARAGPLKY